MTWFALLVIIALITIINTAKSILKINTEIKQELEHIYKFLDKIRDEIGNQDV